ncbi:MAG: DUF1444 family protein [Imperialibacter sp.]|uniref:DUF1444 family protein n=1 Tax=Imperialibacter sp. TaxID=2038411 RepID=UPI003A88B71D
MDEKQFTDLYKTELEKRFPDIEYEITDVLKITASNDGGKVQHYVDNAFREYISRPSDLYEIIGKYVDASGELYSPSEKIDVNRIVPVIKDVGYLSHIMDLAKGDSAKIDLVYEYLNDELVILYSEDLETSVSIFNKEDFLATGIDFADLRQLSISNLQSVLPDMEKSEIEHDIFMVTAGGYYESSLLLLDGIWNKDNFPVDGNIVIAIPARDILLVTSSDDKEAMDKLEKMALSIVETADHYLLPTLFERLGDSWIAIDKKEANTRL